MLNQISLAHHFWASPCGFESTNQLPTSQAAYGHEYWVLCSLQEMYTNQKKEKVASAGWTIGCLSSCSTFKILQVGILDHFSTVYIQWFYILVGNHHGFPLAVINHQPTDIGPLGQAKFCELLRLRRSTALIGLHDVPLRMWSMWSELTIFWIPPSK